MRRPLLIVVTLLCSALYAQGQPTLEQCKQMAREHYPLMRQYDLIAKSEEYTLAKAAKAWLPQFSLSAQATYQSDVVQWSDQFESLLGNMGLDMPGLQKDQYKVQLDLQQTIWDGGKSRADKAIAQGEALQSRMATDVELYSLDSRIEDLFFGILLMQEQQRLLEEMIQRLKNNLDYVNALVENGVATQADADAVQVQILSTNQNLSQVRSQAGSFRRLLELFIGESIGQGPLSTPTTPGEGTPGDITNSLRPEHKLFESQLNLLDAREKMVGVSLTPRFALFAQGFYGYPGLNMFEDMASSKLSLNGIVGVRMSWNIGSFYHSKNTRRELDVARGNIALQRDIFTFNNRLQAEQENAEILRIKSALEDDREIVRLRSSVRQAAEARLQEGTIDTNDLLGKISDESAAKITLSTHEIELLKAFYDLKHTLNR